MKNPLEMLMKQAQGFQEQLKKNQESLATLEVVGEAGAGMVKATLTGRFVCKKLEIEDSAWQEGKTIVEELVCAAINDALQKVLEKNQGQMGQMMSGMGLPENFKFPFTG